MIETDYIPEKTLKLFKMIEDYNLMMSMPHAKQITVLNTLLGKYDYSNYDSIRQTFARLKKDYPEKFKLKKQLAK
jgi:hypothetical protein